MDGLRPGCDDALVRPFKARFAAVEDEMEEDGSLLITGTDALDIVDSVGDDAELVTEGGAEVLFLRCEIVPIVGDELIKGK